jgi:nucleolar protein 15
MNGYFLFGRTLVCQVVPPEKLHPDTFRHANRKWQATPWRDVARKRHNKVRSLPPAPLMLEAVTLGL